MRSSVGQTKKSIPIKRVLLLNLDEAGLFTGQMPLLSPNRVKTMKRATRPKSSHYGKSLDSTMILLRWWLYTRCNQSRVPVSPPGDRRQSFCCRRTDRKRDNFGSTVMYVSRCPPIEEKYGYLDPLKRSR